jgi:hypothetical protein
MLNLRFVDAIHTRLLVRYGSKWVSLYLGVDSDFVRADWAAVLDGVSNAGIRYAMENLPDEYPPNAQQFRALCIRRPQADVLQLPSPKPNPERVARELEKLGGIKNGIEPSNPKAWAYRLKEREADGDRLTMAQTEMLRRAS